jgi:hypothetical protein
VRWAVPDSFDQTRNAGEPDNFDSSEIAKAWNAGHPADRKLCRYESGSLGENLSSEQLAICRSDWPWGRHHVERQINSPKDNQLEIRYQRYWLAKKENRPSARRHEGKPKFKYLLPLDDETAERIKLLSKPYPNAPQAETSLRQTSSLERPVKHRARRSSDKAHWTLERQSWGHSENEAPGRPSESLIWSLEWFSK